MVYFVDNDTGKKIPLLNRIPEVLDVWMDSASMPYAQVHYPFENVEKMEASFPADFIAEYTGQIRAWFYVMHVLGVLVKGSPAFKNVAVTGVINGTDGRKMSKSYGNYPDPKATIEQYGADALRFYLMGGPIMRGEDMNFSETGIAESLKKVLIPLWNSYTFFATYANIDGWKPDGTEVYLIRHGQTKNNAERRLNGGGNDLPLDEVGQEQADVLGVQLRQKSFQPDYIVSSPLSRARETAERVFP
ncbi:MAG: class I tRNA ligase family protein [bacterium]